MDPDVLKLLEIVIPLMAVAVALGMIGWTVNTWIRMKHGYPLDGPWGRPIFPANGGKAGEEIRVLIEKNSLLEAEVEILKDRLDTLERIAVEKPSKLSRDIELLR
ncbi:hypothetical protein ACUXST_000583 [Sphingomonas sp. F9_3S_D5_B_2]